jgi:hypothetical protein
MVSKQHRFKSTPLQRYLYVGIIHFQFEFDIPKAPLPHSSSTWHTSTTEMSISAILSELSTLDAYSGLMSSRWRKGLGCAAFFLFALIALPVLLTGFIWGSFTPILFYGRVIDTDGNPVPQAQVKASFCAFPFGTNIPDDTIADNEGRFWIFGHGMGVGIQTSKTGYYILEQESNGNFAYVAAASATGQSQWHASSSTAAIFRLRKMGQTEPLIYKPTHGGLIARDGTPIQINLSADPSRGVHPDIELQCWTYDKDVPLNSNHGFNWRCKIAVLGGGLQPRKGEFDFIAPENGYQPIDEINMEGTNPKWRSSQSRDYFLKLADGTYARINLSIGAGGYNAFAITSYLNPIAGHRNLEFDLANQSKK